VGFTTATELADTIARTAHVPFRTAHTIVGDLARVGACDLGAIDKVGLRHLGKQLSQLGLTAEDVAEALDVNRKRCKAGHREAGEYLKKRGAKDETIKEFRLGFAPEGWRNLRDALAKKGFTDADMDKAGLVKSKRAGTRD